MDSQESQEHIEPLESCVFERRGMDMSEWGGGDILEKNDCQNKCYCCLMVRWHDAVSDLYDILWPKIGGGVRACSEGPIELFGNQKCQNNLSFS